VPKWLNKDLYVYHGTDSNSVGASSITSGTSLPFTVSLPLCRPYTDFGQGFYVTTYLHQAEQWANKRTVAVNAALPSAAAPTVALVLQFRLSRDWLASLEGLSFVVETPDFWALVDDCRSRFPPHQRTGPQIEYDVVYGPVTLWPQRLLIKDCDQISFHAPGAVASLPSPVVFKKANDSDPTKTSF
jgi:hypothetical protein